MLLIGKLTFFFMLLTGGKLIYIYVINWLIYFFFILLTVKFISFFM